MKEKATMVECLSGAVIIKHRIFYLEDSLLFSSFSIEAATFIICLFLDTWI